MSPGPDDGRGGGLLQSLVPGPIRRHNAAKFVVALLVVVAVVAAVGLVTYVQTQDTIRDDATSKLERSAEMQAATAGEWVDGMGIRTAAVADSRHRPDPDAGQGAVATYLTNASERSGDRVLAIHYVDTEQSQVLASTDSDLGGRSLIRVDRPWASADTTLLDGGPEVRVADSLYTRDGASAVAFAAAVDDTDRIVLVGRPTTALASPATRADVTTHLLTGGGQSMADGGPDSLADADAFGTAREGSTTTVEADGQIRAYTPVDGTDWVVVSTADTDALYAVSDTVGRNVVVLVAAGLVSVLVVGSVLGRHVVSPLVELRDRTEDIEDGRLDVDLSTDREDEIGRLYRSFGSMRDALRAQVQQAEQAKREAETSRQEMERQNRRLDQFASTLSHDLRNPLAVARGHVELLGTKLDDDEELTDHVEKIDDAHDRIDSIIDDVLTLTRKGESVEETERFALEDIATEAWGNIDNKDAELTVAQSITIEGDRSRLLRALENLFRNSIDHVGPGVSVTVGLTEDGFYVQDDGPGIPDEEMGNIFEYGHTTSEDGTGIGLSIVKTIAEAHGWTLWIDGTYEGGARFVFADVFEREQRVFEESAFTWDNAEGDD